MLERDEDIPILKPDKEWLSPVHLQDKPIPERQWIVPDWIPMHTTTSLYGDGGTGKSLIAMQLMTALALHEPWLGQPVEPVRSIGFFCEDTEEELHRRQASINKAYGCDFKDLGDLLWYSGTGEDNTLFEPTEAFQNGCITRLYHIIRERAKMHNAKLIIIDTAADTFGGNENARVQVRKFISLLNSLALAIDGAVLLCAHPSASGMTSGQGTGGNTAWNNSVRSRLYFTRPKQDDDDGQDLTDHRTLSRKKANYARLDESGLKLIWNKGIFTPHVTGTFGMMDKLEKNQADNHAEDAFLKALKSIKAQGRRVSQENVSPKAKIKKINNQNNRI